MGRIVKNIIIGAFLGYAIAFILTLGFYWFTGEFNPNPNTFLGFTNALFALIKQNAAGLIFLPYFTSSVTVISQLGFYLNQQLDAPLHSIESSLIRKQAYAFIREEINTMCSSLRKLKENDGLQNILWEVRELEDFENKCINHTTGHPTGTMHFCNNIQKTVSFRRRKRITDIANCLILKKTYRWWWKKNEFLATETRVPSEIISNEFYYTTQKRELKKRNVDNAQRLLILSRKELCDEMTNHKDAMERFIALNLPEENHYGFKLKIITYPESSDMSEMFRHLGRHLPDNLYDFAISKKGGKINVFAQNSTELRIFESSKDNNSYSEDFYKVFTELYIKEETLTGDFRISSEINGINDVKKELYT